MPTARPFARNTGAAIAGTTQIGNLAVGTPTAGFAATGLPWWNGPDEDPGYVIATEVPANNQPTPVPATTASVGFWRSSALTDASFIDLAQYVSRIAGSPQTFATASAAVTWLTTNGYWTSYVTVPEYTIGQSALGGTIAYINGGGQSGTSGLVISSGQTLGQTDWSSANSAALSYESGGFTDWRLPTIEELQLFYPNRTTLNFIEFLGLYWASTIGDGLNFFNGVPFSSNPANFWLYRAVRQF